MPSHKHEHTHTDTGGASIREVGTDLTVEGRIAASEDEVGTSVRIDKFTGELSNSEVVFHHPLTQAVPETSQAATYARESPHQSTIHFGICRMGKISLQRPSNATRPTNPCKPTKLS